MKTWRLRSSLWVPHPPAAVFPFFADAANLQLLTPSWLSFTMQTPQPVAMAAGALIDYRIRVRGVRLRWRTRITCWDPPHVFGDEQVRGPCARWHHVHTFTACDGGTILGDHVDMRPWGGPFAGVLMALFVRRDVERIFRYRAQVIAAQFGTRHDGAELVWADDGRRGPVSW
ncbi:MAG TPA: SRPBCC family protein [Planctomycetota bacterium]|nr:SRPBCC family protein [Planctomycetota bacterium]